jgi:hypothetical protein
MLRFTQPQNTPQTPKKRLLQLKFKETHPEIRYAWAQCKCLCRQVRKQRGLKVRKQSLRRLRHRRKTIL